jgi:hypothetical protein
MTWFKNSEGRYGANGKKGDAGEDFVEKFLIEKNIKYEKKTDRDSQTRLKIDFLVDGIAMDVKTNVYEKFLGVEIKSKKKGDGWLYTSTAEEIYGVDLDKGNIYKYRLEDMRDYASKNEHRFKITKYGDTLLWAPTTLNFITKLL